MYMQKSVNCCIDIGATYTRVALVECEKVNLLTKFRTSVDPGENFEKINSILKDYEYDNIGIATAGPFTNDLVYGRLPNLPTWEGFNIASCFDSQIPLFVENDAYCSAVCENRSQLRSTLFITISTGIGAGVVVNDNNGKMKTIENLDLYKYMTINNESIEELCSGTGIYQSAINKKLPVTCTRDVFALANQNKIAQEIIEKAKINLIAMIGNLIVVLKPEVVVLGGSVISNNIKWFEEIVCGVTENYKTGINIELAKYPDSNTLLGINKLIEESYEVK